MRRTGRPFLAGYRLPSQTMNRSGNLKTRSVLLAICCTSVTPLSPILSLFSWEISPDPVWSRRLCQKQRVLTPSARRQVTRSGAKAKSLKSTNPAQAPGPSGQDKCYERRFSRIRAGGVFAGMFLGKFVLSLCSKVDCNPLPWRQVLSLGLATGAFDAGNPRNRYL